MREFLDSMDALENAVDLRSRMAEDGYLFFRGLLDPGAVEDLRSDILYSIAAHHWLDRNSDPSEARPDVEERIENADNYWNGSRAIQSLECFHRLAHDGRLVAVMQALFGEAVLVHPRKIPRMIWPQRDYIITPPHQDFTHVGGTVDCFTAWIPLSGCTGGQGGLRVLPGSQNGGVYAMESATGAGSTRSLVDESDPSWSTADYRPGDVLFFHSLTVHGGLPNVTGRLRLSVDYRYQPLSEPLTTWSAGPFYYQGIMRQHGREIDKLPPWSQFTAGWRSTHWVATPEGATVVDAGSMSPAVVHAGSRGGRSRFVDSEALVDQLGRVRPTASVWTLGRPRQPAPQKPPVPA